ncbi:Unknown protein [Striga hermonthica]|uniref:Myb/SANT-like domain-containing protein n=1 Tax=Striga hermonthica TaxID=68872 RepID=A0A9N7N350_STRHE|nr:Unknown protein [Striga hermonthica]
MTSNHFTSQPEVSPPFRSPEDPVKRTDPRTESTGSVSVTSPEKKRKQRRKMSNSVEVGSSKSKQGEAKWSAENEYRLISLMLDQIILGNCTGQKFKTCHWMEIQKQLNNACGPEQAYEITQITSKHDRLKVQWRRFHTMLTTETGFGWESSTGKITGGEDVWGRWITGHPKDGEMKKKVCLHYRELTTIFLGTTATGSRARASTQTPEGMCTGRRMKSPITPTYLFPDELSDEPMNSPEGNRAIRRRKGATSTFDTAMNSITETSRIIQQHAQPEADQVNLQKALRELESMSNVPVPVRKVAWKKFRDPMSLYTFLGLEMEENKRALLDMWMDDGAF